MLDYKELQSKVIDLLRFPLIVAVVFIHGVGKDIFNNFNFIPSNDFILGIYNQLNTRYMKNLFKMYRDWRNRKFVEKIDKLYFHKDKQGNRFMKGTLLVVYDNKTGAYGNVMACLEEDLDKTLSKVSQIRIQLQKEMKHYHDIKSKLTYGS